MTLSSHKNVPLAMREHCRFRINNLVCQRYHRAGYFSDSLFGNTQLVKRFQQVSCYQIKMMLLDR